MRLGKVLDWVLRLTNYHMDMRNEAIYISSEPKSDIFMRLYPVYDLTHPAVDYDGPRINTAMGDDDDDDEDIEGLFGDDDDDDDDFGEGGDEESLIDNIKSHIAPQSWEDETGRISINMYQDNILVMQGASVHAQIGDYLKKLRETRKQQILVNTRILSIRDNFLEQIGVTWGDNDDTAKNSSTAEGISGDNQDVAAGIGVTDFSQDNRSTDHRNYTFGVSMLPGLGAANTATNGGMALDLRYLSRTILNDFEINATIEAVVQNRKGSVLHNPKLLVANGRNAYVEVSTRTNYVSGWEITNNTFEPEIDAYRQGVVYDVKPVISFDKKYITIRMRPALSSLVSNDPREIDGIIIAGDTNPVVIKQELSIGMPQLSLTRIWTYVTVPNGGSVMMGGYIQDNKEELASGVPMISSVPFLGRLTKSDSKLRNKRNLIFITGAKIVELD
jgi:type II secretory pathway component GspD/PulD (secretin)